MESEKECHNCKVLLDDYFLEECVRCWNSFCEECGTEMGWDN